MPEYVMNVAVNGLHYCKIILPSDTDEQAMQRFETIQALFCSDSFTGLSVIHGVSTIHCSINIGKTLITYCLTC